MQPPIDRPVSAPDWKEFSRQFEDHLFNHILPFWSGPAVDHERGGWMAWLSNDLKPDRSRLKGLIVHARILWAFSATYRRRPHAQYRAMADRALEYLMFHFWDQQHGGAFWRVDDSGRPLEQIKKVYGQAFCIYALVEYHFAFGSTVALQQAQAFFCLIERHAHDQMNGGYFEVCSRDWTAVLDAPLSEKDAIERKSMNSQLHVLEAYTHLYRAQKHPDVAARLRELIQLFEDKILNPRTSHLHHFFDERWSVRSDTYTFGHDIEASWLLCEAAEALEEPAQLARIRKLAMRMAEAVLNEAVDATGGLSYEGRNGVVIDPRKECWPQAEAVVGFLNAFQLSGEPRFWHATQNVWSYARNHLVDHVHGEWFWRINEDGQPDASLPKVSEWKGPYHASRMCLEVLNRARTFTAGAVELTVT